MHFVDGLVSRLGLRLQIGLLALVGFAGVALLAGLFLLSDGRIARSLDQAMIATAVYENAAGFDRALLLAKKAEKNFITGGNAAEIANHTAAMAAGLAALADLQADAERGGDPKLREVAAEADIFRGAVRSYGAAFGDILALIEEVGANETAGLQGRLRKSVHEAEAMLNDFDQPRLLVWQLMLRRSEKDFLMRGTATYRDAFEKSYLAFVAAVPGANLDPAAGERLLGLMATYRSDFLKLAASKIILTEKIAAIGKFYSTIEPLLNRWRARVAGQRDVATAALGETRIATRMQTFWTAGLTLLAVSVFAGLIGFGLTRTLQTIVTAMERLARDDRGFDLSRMSGRGEIGKMATALNAFRIAADEAAGLRAAAARAATTAAQDQRLALIAMADTIEHEATVAMVRVGTMTAQMDGTAGTMARSADRTTMSAHAAASAAELALGTAQTVAAAAEELTSSVNEITRQVTHSTTVSRRAVAAAEEAQGVIATLASQARRIGNVAGLISEIASRTNLLALNATIEAARAGDAGRGFAVVAGEVKNLAGQTARATEDISRELDAILEATGGVVRAVDRIDAAIGEADTISASIAAAMDQQGEATAEIARSVGKTASAAQSVAARIQEVSEEASETLRHTDELRGDSATLNSAMMDLKRTIIAVVRASNSEAEPRGETIVERLALPLAA